MNPSLCKMYSLLSFYRRRSPGRWCAAGCTRSPPCSGPTPGGTTPASSGHFGGAWGWQTRSKRSCPPSLPSINSRGGGTCYCPLRWNGSSETDGSDEPNRGEPVNEDHRSGWRRIRIRPIDPASRRCPRRGCHRGWTMSLPPVVVDVWTGPSWHRMAGCILLRAGMSGDERTAVPGSVLWLAVRAIDR